MLVSGRMKKSKRERGIPQGIRDGGEASTLMKTRFRGRAIAPVTGPYRPYKRYHRGLGKIRCPQAAFVRFYILSRLRRFGEFRGGKPSGAFFAIFPPRVKTGAELVPS